MSIEMAIYGVGKSPESDGPLVVLKEANRDRFLAIAVGQLEIAGIAAALAGMKPPRPMTHDLLCSALEACGARVTRAIVHSLIDGVFHARLILDVQGRHAELDSRSSDAIAVAVRAGIPVHVEEEVLERAGITPQPEGKGAEAREAPAGERITEEQLGAFRDVIRDLDIDDLGPSGKGS